MASDNRVSAEVTAAVLQQVLASLNEIRTRLPFLVNLTADERKRIPNISTSRSAMDDAFSQQITAHPELVPNYVDTDGLTKDRALRASLLQIASRVEELLLALSDTSQAAGSDIYMAYMAFYNNVQQAARRGVTGADAVLADIQRFIPRGPRKPAPPAPQP